MGSRRGVERGQVLGVAVHSGLVPLDLFGVRMVSKQREEAAESGIDVPGCVQGQSFECAESDRVRELSPRLGEDCR